MARGVLVPPIPEFEGVGGVLWPLRPRMSRPSWPRHGGLCPRFRPCLVLSCLQSALSHPSVPPT
eukprot:1489175-Alexandrium_andersonii.AAC.1